MSEPGHRRGCLVNFQKASVLSVDPSVLASEVLTIMLNGFGFRKIHRSGTIEAAIKSIQQHTFDIIFIDPYSFGEQAYNFISWIRSEKESANKDTIIIISTPYTDINLISASRRCSVDYVLNKPFSSRTLLDRIIWLAEQDSRQTDLMAPSQFVSQSGSGVELW